MNTENGKQNFTNAVTLREMFFCVFFLRAILSFVLDGCDLRNNEAVELSLLDYFETSANISRVWVGSYDFRRLTRLKIKRHLLS